MAKPSKKTAMKAVIFAGGVGSRMWPLSREATPKQFEKLIDNKSTLQLAVDRIRPEFKPKDIYISSGEKYTALIKKQLPFIPKKNIISEPEMRDVAPAVGYLMAILSKDFSNTPVAILWSDHLVKNIKQFKNALATGGQYLKKDPKKIVFLGQKPRFASQNLGWIKHGSQIDKINGLSIKKFVSWHYRPNLARASKYFKSSDYAWNPGYFVVTPKFVMDQFAKHAPDMYQQLVRLKKSYSSPNHHKILKDIYPKFKKIHFDNLILEKIAPNEAVVISVDLGWSDVGAWEAFKEALQTSPQENLTHGNVKTKNTTDTLVYSYTNQLVSTIDLKGMIIVVTPDVILVTKKESIPQVKKLVQELKQSGMEQFT